MVDNIEERKDCPMRHENGNCMVIGGFCIDAVSDEICHGLHNAYNKGLRDGAERMKNILKQRTEENITMIPTKASDFASWSHKEIADFFWYNIGLYVKKPDFQTLQNMKYAYLWAVHDDYELAKTFKEAMKWSGIDNIFSEFTKHGWN